jgi:hypothetical protein
MLLPSVPTLFPPFNFSRRIVQRCKYHLHLRASRCFLFPLQPGSGLTHVCMFLFLIFSLLPIYLSLLLKRRTLFSHKIDFLKLGTLTATLLIRTKRACVDAPPPPKPVWNNNGNAKIIAHIRRRRLSLHISSPFCTKQRTVSCVQDENACDHNWEVIIHVMLLKCKDIERIFVFKCLLD